MKISSATAASLGEKLASLDLTPEEGVLLTSMLNANEEGAEVEGFGKPSGRAEVTRGYTEVEWTYVKPVLGPLPGTWKVEEGEGYTKVEWT